jgi:hypothetical protein
MQLLPFECVSALLDGCLNDSALIRSVLIRSIKECSKSRAQIADEISRLTGRKITEVTLNKFTAESRGDYRWPAELNRAFCVATGSDLLLHAIAEAAGYMMIRGEDVELLELGREYLRQKRASEKVAILERHLAGVDL